MQTFFKSFYLNVVKKLCNDWESHVEFGLMNRCWGNVVLILKHQRMDIIEIKMLFQRLKLIEA